ncbi:MAG TPA: hypothetical protein VLT13_13955, partial [Bacteroidota bacterium]|nr:hypothetical protein [Bacteroidota bacterium]
VLDSADFMCYLADTLHTGAEASTGPLTGLSHVVATRIHRSSLQKVKSGYRDNAPGNATQGSGHRTFVLQTLRRTTSCCVVSAWYHQG